MGFSIDEIREINNYVKKKIQDDQQSYMKWAFKLFSRKKDWTAKDQKQYYMQRFIEKSMDPEVIEFLR